MSMQKQDPSALPPVPPKRMTGLNSYSTPPTAQAIDSRGNVLQGQENEKPAFIAPPAPQPPRVDPGMSRTGPRYVDPSQVVAELSSADLEQIKLMNMDHLSRYLGELGLRELPKKVLENGLSGSILHTINERDIEKMNFSILGEAKAFSTLIDRLKIPVRGVARGEMLHEKGLVFWGTMHQWFPGPCDICNCGFKTERDSRQKCNDTCCCRPVKLHQLPPSTIEVYRDHLTIKTPRWNGEMPQEYREYQHGFAGLNVTPFHVVSDNIDFSNILDVDLEETPKLGDYKYSTADWCNRCCCRSLRREPGGGDFYWVSNRQKCCGYEHEYKERAEGYITIKLRHSEGSKKSGSDIKRFGVVEGASDITKAIMHFMEESQLNRVVRIS